MERGVKPGMTLAEAEALLEQPEATSSEEGNVTAKDTFFQTADVSADVAGLRQLALCCERFTPRFGIEEVEPPESLWLDLTGCTHLFGGDQGTAMTMATDFRHHGLQARIGLAPTLGAAWAVAHCLSRPMSPALVEATRLASVLDPLPVDALRLTPKLLDTLRELGLRTIGQLRKLPRASLPSRFGPLLLQRLDQAFGDSPEQPVPEQRRDAFAASWVGEFPIVSEAGLEEVGRELLDQLLRRLQPQRLGVRQLRCELRDGRGRQHDLQIGFVAATEQQRHIFEMLTLQWERTALPDEIVAVRLEATVTEPLRVVQRDLFGHELNRDQQRDIASLLDRLSNRLGADRVVRARLQPELQPELAVSHEPWTQTKSSAAIGETTRLTTQRGVQRPTQLFASPQHIEVSRAGPEGAPLSFWWQRHEHRVIRSWGPERIETGWWRESSVCRDYFRVEVLTGHHFWIFHCLDEQVWFIHGTFD